MNGNPNRMRQGRKKGNRNRRNHKTWVTYFITKTHQKNRILNYYCISYTTAVAVVVVVVAHRLGAPHYFVIKTTLPALP